MADIRAVKLEQPHRVNFFTLHRGMNQIGHYKTWEELVEKIRAYSADQRVNPRFLVARYAGIRVDPAQIRAALWQVFSKEERRLWRSGW